MGSVMNVPWKLIAKAFGCQSSFRLEGASPRLVTHYKNHTERLAGADACKRAVLISIRTPEFVNPKGRPNS